MCQQDEDYVAFMAMLPDLLREHAGRWALLHHGALVDLFDSATSAHQEGERRFPDGAFSLQQVSGSILALNWISCCGS
ncbi:MAG: hypothetical protein HQL89_08310 [Magnetococcales bacterium]|nr:hypothetical protein [Magnetococcales bacterium]